MTAAKPQRFASLDVFRGVTIFLMILVNTAGPGAPAFAQLVHARWIGFTLADLVFPSFLFAMGNAMSFAMRKPIATGPYLANLARRGMIIFALGFLMYWYPFVRHDADGWSLAPFALTRVPGVLQRLALCYVLTGLVVRWLDWKKLVLACVALLLGYWAILLAFSLPGEAYSKTGNAGTLLDLYLLPREHLYKKDGGFDPEGFLGTLPATVNVIAGYLAASPSCTRVRSKGRCGRLRWGAGAYRGCSSLESVVPDSQEAVDRPVRAPHRGTGHDPVGARQLAVRGQGAARGQALLHDPRAQSAGDLPVLRTLRGYA
ncbi:acyltransferase family protein [Novosphingobium resinovorum]